ELLRRDRPQPLPRHQKVDMTFPLNPELGRMIDPNIPDPQLQTLARPIQNTIKVILTSFAGLNRIASLQTTVPRQRPDRTPIDLGQAVNIRMEPDRIEVDAGLDGFVVNHVCQCSAD